jgi:SAM-dependent methyltransferase
MTATRPADQVLEAYDALAPIYDVLISAYPHERWLAGLEQLALAHGLAGRRVLDLACGTGESFLPLVARGYQVVGCDISGEMLNRARAKAPAVELHREDMRRLPKLGSFDLVTCIDDALNYFLSEHELEDALRGIARNLGPDGIAIWDLNTLAQYHRQFASDLILDQDGTFIGWRGARRAKPLRAGERIAVAVDAFIDIGDGYWRRITSVHYQRHWPASTIERLSRRAGLQLLDVRGQHPGAVIDSVLAELIHTKAIYVACRTNKEELMSIGGP